VKYDSLYYMKRFTENLCLCEMIRTSFQPNLYKTKGVKRITLSYEMINMLKTLKSPLTKVNDKVTTRIPLEE